MRALAAALAASRGCLRWRARRPVSSARNAAQCIRNGSAAARPAAPGTASSRRRARVAAEGHRRQGSRRRQGARDRFRRLARQQRADAAPAERHRRVRPGLRRRPRRRLGIAGRRRSRHRQIDAAAAGRGRARARQGPGKVERRACPLRLYLGRGGDRPGADARRPPRCRRRAGRARDRDQHPRHHGGARPAGRRPDRRHRFDPDDVSRHARQRARHGQPGARRGAGADPPRQAPRLHR